MSKLIFIIILSVIGHLSSAICLNAQDFSQAQIQYLKGEYKQSIDTLEKILASDVDRKSAANVYYLLGLSYLKAVNYLRASDCFEILVNEYPQEKLSKLAGIKLIDIELAKGSYKEAQDKCEKFQADATFADFQSQLLYRKYLAKLKMGKQQEAQLAMENLNTAYQQAPELRASITDLESDGFFSIQVGSFQDIANAQKLLNEISEKGYDAFILNASDNQGRGLFKVRVGKLKTRQEAIDLEQRLTKEGLPTKICPY